MSFSILSWFIDTCSHFYYSRKVHHVLNNLAFLGIPLENPLEKCNVEKRLGFIATIFTKRKKIPSMKEIPMF